MADERALKKEDEGAVNSFSGEDQEGYCPYTPDRRCKTGKGGWSDSETCKECGWRAW